MNNKTEKVNNAVNILRDINMVPPTICQLSNTEKHSNSAVNTQTHVSTKASMHSIFNFLVFP